VLTKLKHFFIVQASEEENLAGNRAFIALLIAVALIAGGGEQQTKSSPPPPTAAPAKHPEKEGSYNQYRYWVGGPKENNYAVTFQPFLERNDATVMGALRAAATTAYGQDVLGETAPSLDSTDAIVYSTPSGRYAFLITKEDTGLVNGASFWKE
jgi:hypothetical protein